MRRISGNDRDQEQSACSEVRLSNDGTARSSQDDGSPGDAWSILRVNGGWVSELTIVILGVQVSLGSLANSDEVLNSELVGEVLVEVVLEVLDEVHVLLDESVSSDSWEGESGVIELPGVDVDLWVHTEVLLKLLVDLHGLLVMFSVETS